MQELIAAEKISPDGDSAAEAAKIAGQLKKDGVDILWLMAQRERVTLLREKQEQALTKSVVKKLDGKRVRLTGYVLPLKFADGRVTEFFLIPSIVSCSHSAPPPANRVVYELTLQTGTLEMNTRLLIFATIAFAPAAMAVGEDDRPIEIKWNILAPPEGDQYRDPFAKLTRQQL